HRPRLSFPPRRSSDLELVDAAEEAYREVKKEVESQSANVQAVALNRQGELVKITKELKVLSQQASGTMKDRILEGYKKVRGWSRDRKSTRLNSSHVKI